MHALKPALKQYWTKLAVSLALLNFASLLNPLALPPAHADETWEKLDRHLKMQVLKLNVALKLKLKSGLFVQLTDADPKYRYPVFGTTPDDRGYRVVGYGTAFPIASRDAGKTYYVTNKHVVTTGDELVKECERFYAAMRLAAEKTAKDGNVDGRFKELLAIVNLSMKKDMNANERAVYNSTIDGIWDVYEAYLSLKADPGRLLFQRYLAQVGVDHEVGYFLHKVGPSTQPAIQAALYKTARTDKEPDLSILTSAPNSIPPLELDAIAPSEGQDIQVVGYPKASEQIDVDAEQYYTPTFSSGHISRVAPRMLQVDAPITNGNSGGPVVSVRGKVVGVVANRAMSASGKELTTFGGAVTIDSIRGFAPELFSGARPAPQSSF
jgi:hypothetical protein